MKKLFLIALAISAFAWLGCGDTMTDQMGTNSANGNEVDLFNGVYGITFDGVTEYTDVAGATFDVVDGRLIMDREGTVNMSASYYADRNDFNGDGDYVDTVDGVLENYATKIVFFGIDNPNKAATAAADLVYSIPMELTVQGSLADVPCSLTIVIAGVDANLESNNAIQVTLMNRGGINHALAGTYGVLLTVGTTNVAYSDAISGFDLTADYAITLQIADNGSATQGPDINVAVNGTPVISYAGATGLVLGNPAGAFSTATWAGNWQAMIWKNSLLPAPSNTARFLFLSQISVDKLAALEGGGQDGKNDKAPSLNAVQMSAE